MKLRLFDLQPDLSTLGEEKILSDSFFDLSRLLLREWFCQTHCLTCRDTCWEDGSLRLTDLSKLLVEDSYFKTPGEKMVVSNALSDLCCQTHYLTCQDLVRK